MRAARRRLAQARQRIRRLSWMARDPESLHPDVPLLSLPAFLRALARFQTIRTAHERACLLVMRTKPCDLPLRRAVAMHLIENTRNCDTLGCAGSDTFLLLLKGADEAGGEAAARRLQVELRQLAARHGRLLRLHVSMQSLHPRLHPRDILPLLSAADEAIAPEALPALHDAINAAGIVQP